MRVVWSLPVLADRLGSGRGDLVRAAALVDALRAAGHRVEVVEAAGGGDGRDAYRRVVRPLLPERLALVLRDLVRRWRARRHAREVARVVGEEGAEVIVETQVHGLPSGSRAARRSGVPLVLDDVSPPSEERVLGAGLPGLAERAFRREARAARALVVSSDPLLRRLASLGLPRERLAVVPNGVRLDAHRRADGRAARRRLGLEDRLVIGFVGSFQPWHRVDLLVEATARLADQVPVHLLLVGDGPGLEGALEAAGELGIRDRIRSAGLRPPEQVPALLAACDVGALPGTNEYGQPMKLLDYAAAGLAIVAPDVPPVRESVEDERTGLLFPAGDVAALAGVLRRLAADRALREELGERARRDVAELASWERRAEELAAVLRAVRVRTPEGRAP